MTSTPPNVQKNSVRPVRRVSPRLPFPSSVYIFNGIYDREVAFGGRSNNKVNWFNLPDPNVSLLYAVRLELVVTEVDEHDNKNDRILYSKTVSTGTIQAVWHHLNESVCTTELSVEAYESMTLRFYLLDQNMHSEPFEKLPITSYSSIHTNETCHRIEKPLTSTGAGLLWQQLLIHPSKLVRLGSLPEPHQQQQLPLNLIVVEYTDKSLRVTQSNYQLLVESNNPQVELLVVASVHSKVKMESQTDDGFGRFKDTVFSTLDQVNPVERKRKENFHDLLKPASDETSASAAQSDTYSVASSERPQKEEDNEDALQHHKFLKKQQRKAQLEAAIREEEQALRQEMSELGRWQTSIQSLQEQLSVTKHRSQLVREATECERKKGRKTSFALQAQQIRLVRELQSIFPITVMIGGSGEAQQRYSICGLVLPQELVNTSEEDLSAALGYTCHLVHMLSKYLAVQLRYRLLCHNARSGIQDDKAVLYPLFQARNIDRDQLEHGIRLLNRNVDCLCRERDIVVSPKLHILGKVKRIYEHVVDGY